MPSHANHLLEAAQRFADSQLPVGSELSSDLVTVRHAIDLIELKFSQMAAAFAATDEYDTQGSVSPLHWIRHNCHMTAGAAGDRLAVGEQLANLPESVETMDQGAIGFAHLALITRTATAVAESESGKPFNRRTSSTRHESSRWDAFATSATTRAMAPIRKAMPPSRCKASKRAR